MTLSGFPFCRITLHCLISMLFDNWTDAWLCLIIKYMHLQESLAKLNEARPSVAKSKSNVTKKDGFL